MSRRDLTPSIVGGLVLSLIAIWFIFSRNGVLSFSSASAQTEIDSIRQLMLTSHENWSTLQGEALTTWHLRNGGTDLVTSEFAIANSTQSRFELPTLGFMWINTSQTIYEINNNELTYFKFTQPDIERELSLLPTTLDGVVKGDIYRHPVAMSTSSPIADYIFPVGLAQRQGEYKILGEETVAGRKTWVITFVLKSGGEVSISSKYWVDQELGNILKAEVYSTERLGQLSEEMLFQWIEIDAEIPEDAFAPPLDGYNETNPN